MPLPPPPLLSLVLGLGLGLGLLQREIRPRLPEPNLRPPVPPPAPAAALWFAAGPASPDAALAAGDAADSSAAWRRFWGARGLVPPRSAAGAPGASARSLAFMLTALDRGGGAVAAALCCVPGAAAGGPRPRMPIAPAGRRPAPA